MKFSERETLIKVAKIAGITLPEFWNFCDSSAHTFWNPIRSSSDAFNLAVKCLPFHALSYSAQEYELCHQNAYAATRLAIVNAVLSKEVQ